MLLSTLSLAKGNLSLSMQAKAMTDSSTSALSKASGKDNILEYTMSISLPTISSQSQSAITWVASAGSRSRLKTNRLKRVRSMVWNMLNSSCETETVSEECEEEPAIVVEEGGVVWLTVKVIL